MKNYLILTILFSLLMSYTSFGQAPGCGTIPTQEDIDYLTETREMRQAFSDNIQDRDVIRIPITNHIVRQSNGSGGLSTQELATAIQELNDFYAQAGIEFYECGTTQFIDSDTWYNFSSPDENNMTNANNVANTINIYHCNSITIPGFGGACGYAYYPTSNRDVVLMKNSCTLNGSTLIHELGHYFSLYHTHGKGGCTSSDELVNGSNCSTAGDDLCDTPADPCLSGTVSSSCTYIGNATDANGQTYTPQPNNIMSYSRKACRNFMTPQQLNRVVASAMIDRSYLFCDNCTDNDDDGICQEDDCNDNDANFPKPQGTSCNDGNSSTINDVIQSDGCTCQGDSNNDNPCEAIQVSVSGDNVIINNITSSSMTLQIIGEGTGWANQPICSGGSCGSSQIVSGLAEGNYTVKAFNSNPGCYASRDVEIDGTGGCAIDNDNDGVCQQDDCNDNDANFPKPQGTPCDDGDANTTNDVIQIDGCTCQGTTPPGNCGVDLVSFTRTNGAANCDEYELTIGISQNEAASVLLSDLPANGYAGSVPGVGSLGWASQTSFTWNIPANSNGLHTATLEYCWAADANAQATFNDGTCNDVIIIGGGADVISTNTDISIYPNPAKDKVFLQLEALAGSQGTIAIFNSIGQTVKTFAFREIPYAPIQWDTNEATNGIYLIAIQTNDQRIVKKVIINKTY